MSQRTIGVFGLLVFAGLIGCRVGPEHCIPPSTVAPEWSHVSSAGITADPPDALAWWVLFNDPLLNEYVLRSANQNLSLGAAAERIAQARAQRGVARGGLFPDVNANASYTRADISDNASPFGSSATIPPFDLWLAGFDAAWEIDVFGRVRRTIEAATADIGVAAEARNDLLVTLLGDVATNYVQARTLQQRIEVARSNIQLQSATLKLAEDRFSLGAVGELDVFQARSNLNRTEAAIPLLERDLEITINRLAVLQGLTPGQVLPGLEESRPIPDPPQTIAVGIPINLLRQRPDVRQAERALAAQAARIGIATADLYPRFSLAGTFTVDATEIEDWFTGESIAYRVGPSVIWNILNFGRVRSNIAVQEALWRELAFNYRQIILDAAEEVENAISGYVHNRESAIELDEAVIAARQAAELAEFQYRQGATDFQRVLDAQRFLTELQDQSVQARGQVVVSLVALYKALGGGWQPAAWVVPAPVGAIVEEVSPPAPTPLPDPAFELPPEPPMPIIEPLQ
jgi:NodT family efflux transporter outer membrane factor (OMF) lipoprotein